MECLYLLNQISQTSSICVCSFLDFKNFIDGYCREGIGNILME